MLGTPTTLSEARALVRGIKKAAEVLGRDIPAPPEEPLPDDCCGRGCEQCVFTVYYDAVEDWRLEITGLDSPNPPEE